MPALHPARPGLAALVLLVISAILSASEFRTIQQKHEPKTSGKDPNWIHGDYLMQNNQVSVITSAPSPTRDANMAIRNIGGLILDAAVNLPSKNQVSAYTPTAGRYLFQDPSQVTMGREGDTVSWQCRSSRSIAKDGSTATVRCRLPDRHAFVESTVWMEGKRAEQVLAYDNQIGLLLPSIEELQ